jgi:hypothetical protein
MFRAGAFRYAAFEPVRDLIPGPVGQVGDTLFVPVEHRQLWSRNNEGELPFLNPGLVQRPIAEQVVKIFDSISPLAIAVEKQDKRPALRLLLFIFVGYVEKKMSSFLVDSTDIGYGIHSPV